MKYRELGAEDFRNLIGFLAHLWCGRGEGERWRYRRPDLRREYQQHTRHRDALSSTSAFGSRCIQGSIRPIGMIQSVPASA